MTPESPTEIRSFLGLAGYYRRFIENFSKIAKPLTLLTQKNKAYVWGDKQDEAFQILKEKLCNAPVLEAPHPYYDFCERKAKIFHRISKPQLNAKRIINDTLSNEIMVNFTSLIDTGSILGAVVTGYIDQGRWRKYKQDFIPMRLNETWVAYFTSFKTVMSDSRQLMETTSFSDTIGYKTTHREYVRLPTLRRTVRLPTTSINMWAPFEALTGENG
ncbi:hypothetical protein Tco_0084976 [Tanacetum coccineum]